MQLTLSIISYHRLTPGQESVKHFGASGGTIGRAPENSWVLPDPERLVSGKHAEILLSNGKFYVIDHSTNGLFVSTPGQPHPQQPLGKGNRAELRHGQLVTLGEYELEVAITTTSAAVSPSDETDPFVKLYQKPDDLDPLAFLDAPLEPVAADTSAPAPKVNALDLGKDQDFFRPAQPVIPDDWDDLLGSLSSTPSPPKQATPAIAPPQPAAPSIPVVPMTIADELPASIPPPPAAPVNREPPPAPPQAAPSAPVEVEGIELFLNALGLKPEHVPPAARQDLLAIAGSMLRITIESLLDVLRTRASVKSELRAEQTMIRSAENNPLKFSAGVDDALFNLFTKRLPGFLAPQDAIRAAMDDIKYHQVALMAGVEASQSTLLDALNPKQFSEASVGGSLLDRLTPSGKKAGAWDQFVERYDELVKSSAGQSQLLFKEAFEKAYSAQMTQLKSSAKR